MSNKTINCKAQSRKVTTRDYYAVISIVWCIKHEARLIMGIRDHRCKFIKSAVSQDKGVDLKKG